MTNRNIIITFRVRDRIDDIEVVLPYHRHVSKTIKQLIEDKQLAAEIVTLSLNHGGIQSVDLDFLEGCEHLKQLELRDNNIESINLSYVKHTPRLETIDISVNNIRNLDLTPLALCRNLQTVNLLDNPLDELNLAPLLFCDKLGHLMFPGDVSTGAPHSSHGDGTLQSQAIRVFWSHILVWNPPPWVELLGPEFRVRKTDYQNVIDMLGWDTVKDLLRKYTQRLPEESWYPIQAKTLEALGIGEIACYDGHPIDIIECIPSESDFNSARQVAYQSIVDLLRENLQRGGSTFCFNIERMRKTQASILIPLVVERRKQEMSEVVIRVYGEKVDLRSLQKSHYGREIMRALSLGKETDRKGLHRLRKKLKLAGIEINVDENH
ncbi:MAG: hypothetical protein RTU92_11125 [Candidatus Thorarchaeota archaeon]